MSVINKVMYAGTFINLLALWLWIYCNGITIHGRFYYKNSNSEWYYLTLIFIPLYFSYIFYQWWIEWSFNRGIDTKNEIEK